MTDALLAGIDAAFSAPALMANLAGVVLGIIFGALPGLTFSTALILMLPLTFVLDPIPAMALLLGVYVGGMTGGSVSAILLGIPGTPSAACTVIDGVPLRDKGQAGKALGVALVASVIAGMISLCILAVVAPYVARIAIKFGSAEIFALVLFGFSTIVGVSSGSILKGLMSGVIGMMLMTVGMDSIMGTPRFTLGYYPLYSGVSLLAAMIGLFAIPQIIADLPRNGKKQNNVRPHDNLKITTELPNFKHFKRCFGAIFRGALIGTGVGSIPGTGGPIGAFLSYDINKKFSKKKEEWGKGSLEGIAAAESGNNGVTGGTLIPMLTLGIPGDPGTAIMLGALLIHGLTPGPLLFKDNATVVYGILVALFITNILVLIVQWFGIRVFLKILQIPKTYIFPVVMVLTTIGAYSVRNNMLDIYIMGIFGVLGCFLKKYNFPSTPVILAIVLGPTIEAEFRRALIVSGGDYSIFITRPITFLFLILTFLVLAGPAIRTLLSKAILSFAKGK